MRLRDLSDYLRLRRIAANPWEVVRFRKGHREGQELSVDLRDGPPVRLQGGRSDVNTFRTIWLEDEYKFADLPPASPGAARVGCVIDLGANVGLFAARAARVAARVICYEPMPENFERLQLNVAGFDHVTTVNEAVAAEAGALPLYAPKNARSNGQFTLYPGADDIGGPVREVPVTTLATLFETHGVGRCDLLKIDAEGAEYDILLTAPDELLARIGRIHAEYHAVEGRTIEELAERLRTSGFEVTLDAKPHGPNYGLFFARRPGWTDGG